MSHVDVRSAAYAHRVAGCAHPTQEAASVVDVPGAHPRRNRANAPGNDFALGVRLAAAASREVRYWRRNPPFRASAAGPMRRPRIGTTTAVHIARPSPASGSGRAHPIGTGTCLRAGMTTAVDARTTPETRRKAPENKRFGGDRHTRRLVRSATRGLKSTSRFRRLPACGPCRNSKRGAHDRHHRDRRPSPADPVGD